MDYARMFNTLLGTALVASGAAALNQWQERELGRADAPHAGSALCRRAGCNRDGAAVWRRLRAAAGLIYLAFAGEPASRVCSARSRSSATFSFTRR